MLSMRCRAFRRSNYAEIYDACKPVTAWSRSATQDLHSESVHALTLPVLWATRAVHPELLAALNYLTVLAHLLDRGADLEPV